MDACLAGETVVFTGRLASLTRAEAARVVEQYGGEFARSVSAQTTLLIIGQEGWPLQADGSITRKLRTARNFVEMGSPLAILTEEEWLHRLNLKSNLDRVRRHLSSAELSHLLGVPRDRLRAWIRAGLITPLHEVTGVSFFGFREASRARMLCELAGRGVTIERIRHSLAELRCWLPDVDQSLSLLERDGRLFVRLREELLAEPSGQLCWDFSDDIGLLVTFEDSPPSADDWFERGWSHEQAGQMNEAEFAYRQALRSGQPNPKLCFNLGNVLYALGRREAAAERYEQAVELDGQHAEAWNNLGNVLAELGRCDEAATAYERALVANSKYAEAHYNFADLLSQSNCPDAAKHWQEFLRLEPSGPWAVHARSQLASS